MTKGSGDLILRDRMQFTVGSGSDNALVWGRFDLSDYTSITKLEGIRLKEVRFQLRDPNNAGTVDVDETGIWFPGPDVSAWLASAANLGGGGVKMCASTIAYESMTDIGIASPGVYALEEISWLAYTVDLSTSGPPDDRLGALLSSHWNRYGVEDLHPGGAIVVSDLLIGVAIDSGGIYQEDDIIELDVQLIIKKAKVTQKAMTQLLTQAQDV